LNGDEIQHWVVLLFAIVRVAEAKAEQLTKFNSQDEVDLGATLAEREGSKYRVNDQWHQSTAEQLCGPDLLDLGPAEIEYWKGRYELYKQDIARPPWM
jgi:hypothetical protein